MNCDKCEYCFGASINPECDKAGKPINQLSICPLDKQKGGTMDTKKVMEVKKKAEEAINLVIKGLEESTGMEVLTIYVRSKHQDTEIERSITMPRASITLKI